MLVAVGCKTIQEYLIYQKERRAESDGNQFMFVNHPADCYGNIFSKAVILPSFAAIYQQEIVYDVIVRHMVGQNEELIEDRRFKFIPIPNETPIKKRMTDVEPKPIPQPPAPKPKQPIIVATKQEIEKAKEIKNLIGLVVNNVEQYQRFKEFFPNAKTHCILRAADIQVIEAFKINEVVLCGTYWLNPNFEWLVSQFKIKNILVYTIGGKLVAL